MAHASRASSHCSASRRFVTAPPAYFFRHDAPPLAALWQDRSSPDGSVRPSTRTAGGVIPGFCNDNAAVRVPHQDGRTIFERDGAFHGQGERSWPALCMLWRLAKLICQLGGAAHRHAVLGVEERAEQRGPRFLEVDFPLESALQKSLDSLPRFRPRQRGLKGVEGVEEPVGGWQRDSVDEVLGCRDRSAVSPSKSFAPRTISSARPRPTRCGRRSVPPPPGCTPTPTSGWPSRVFSRDAKRMSQARTNSLLPPRTQPRIFAILTTGDFVRRTNVSIRIGRPDGPTAVVMFPMLPVKSKWAR